MRIAIDARSLSWEKGKYTGVSTYLYETMVALSLYYPEHSYYVLAPRPFSMAHTFPENWHFMTQGKISERGKIWALLELPKILKKEQFDIYWGPNFTLPKVMGRCKTAFFVTIHDLAMWHFPEVAEKSNFIRVRVGAKKAIKRARKVLTISQSTKEDLVNTLNVPADKIGIVYPGGVEQVPEDSASARPAFLPEELPYFLFISTIEPRKNILTIIKAFEVFRAKESKPYLLVLAGKKGWNCAEIYVAAKSSPYAQDIIMPGYITSEEKDYLYRHTTAVLYPSLFEGFGIPVLEAFAYKAPVITARNSSLPEVGGEGALYIEKATDAQVLCEKMQELIAYSDAQRETLLTNARTQLQRFTWQHSAEQIMKQFREVQERD